jgi:hypothetical protein
MDNQAIVFGFPEGKRDFSLFQRVQIDYGTNPTSYSMDIAESFLGA